MATAKKGAGSEYLQAVHGTVTLRGLSNVRSVGVEGREVFVRVGEEFDAPEMNATGDGTASSRSRLKVFKVVRAAGFNVLFRSLLTSTENTDVLALTQDEIIEVGDAHPEALSPAPAGTTFILFRTKTQRFVAAISREGGGLAIDADRFVRGSLDVMVGDCIVVPSVV